MEGCRGGCAQGNGPGPKDNVEADEPVRIVAAMSTSFRFLAVACVGFSAAVSAFAAEAAKVNAAEKWRSLFDGKTLAGWMPSEFESGGAVKVENPFRGGPGAIVIAAGTTLSGFTWTKGGELPRENYEITLEAMKLTGSDFFLRPHVSRREIGVQPDRRRLGRDGDRALEHRPHRRIGE